MSSGKLLKLDQEEFQWVSIQISKLNARLKPNERKKSKYKLIRRLFAKFDPVQFDALVKIGSFNVRVNRQEARALKELLEVSSSVLVDKIIPAYKERKEKRTEDGVNYDEYIGKAEALAEVFKGLDKKLEECL